VADEAGQVKRSDLDAEAQARRRVALARIRQFGDPVLRMRANEVEEFDDELARLAERMTALMQDAQGVGIAGNQVGVVRRIVIVQADADEEPVALVNPRLVDVSEERETGEEGCLSLQGVIVPVERPARVTVEALDVAGAPLRLELEETGARVAQHEIDHLDGVLILDRTTDEARREALGTLRPDPALR
jgi:peptide deformylase